MRMRLSTTRRPTRCHYCEGKIEAGDLAFSLYGGKAHARCLLDHLRTMRLGLDAAYHKAARLLLNRTLRATPTPTRQAKKC